MRYSIILAAAVLAMTASGFAGDVTPQRLQGFGDGEYRLGPGDVVEVFVWKEPDLTTTVVVRPDGKISLPLIAEFQASGKTAGQLQSEITTGLQKYLSEPVVNVIIKEVNAPKISVLGNVRKPDVFKMQNKITVLDAIALAGGFTDFARRDRVTIIRNGSSGTQQKIKVNLKRYLNTRDYSEAFYLQQNDTVYVD